MALGVRASMLGTTNLGKSYGGRVLFEGVNLKLNPGSRYGLVGANGSGKTTFLNILAGDDAATDGSVNLPKTARLGVLRQDRFLNDDDAIIDVACAGDALVWTALAEQRKLTEFGTDPERAAELEDLIRTHDGYTLEARASFILEGLGIPVPAHRQPLATLSGGFKLRVLLAQVLLGGPDAVLLDEPTNHLDILSIRWLEKFLMAYKGCAVVISHDQRFLDNVATHVLDVDYGTVTLFTGNFSTFVVEKQAIRARKQAGVDKAEAIIAHKRLFIERFGAKATKASQAQSRLKQIEKIEVEELADSSRRSPKFQFSPERPSGREVLTIESVSKSYGEKQVLRDVSLVVRRGERLAVIGPNGLGKSTLLKILMGRVEADKGTSRWGHEARPGYFAQDHREVLDDEKATVLEVLWATRPTESTSFVRGHLGRVLFSGADVNKRVASLSGGEAARLVFGCLAAAQPNVLVLDEPTNHLDLESIHALVEALKTYVGTIIFVSHDRWFVSELATRILEVTPEGPRNFDGTYAEYLSRCGDDHLDAEAVVLKVKKAQKTEPPARSSSAPGAAPAAAPAGPPGETWEEQKRRRNRLKDLPIRRDRMLAAINGAESRKAAIHEVYAFPGFFEKTPKPQIEALVAEESALGKTIELMLKEWELIEQELAAAGV